ncbi:MAG: HTH domain-containing protein [Ornithinimicrobium sp.]
MVVRRVLGRAGAGKERSVRASRLLMMLLLVQNRGRMTTGELARELEVSTRTVLRDVDALSEAGLPVIVQAGRGGGIELGFNYRTRLTGLSGDEAEALGVLLGRESPELNALGMATSVARAKTKLLESLPDPSRHIAQRAAEQFRITPARLPEDERLTALADAVCPRRVVRIRSRGPQPRTIHPVKLTLAAHGWELDDALDPGSPVPLERCGTVNISSRVFA